MAVGAIMMILVLYKSTVIWKESSGFRGLELVKVVFRDQALYFSVYVCSL